MKRAIWAILTAAAFFLFAVRSNVYCLGAGLLLVLLPLVSLILAWIRRSGLEIRLSAPVTVEKGREIPLEMQAEGGSIRARLDIVNSVTGEEISQKLWLSGRETLPVREAYCGCLRITLSHIFLTDAFGIFGLPVRKTVSKRVRIMPETYAISSERTLELARLTDSTDYDPYVKGQDLTETFQIRDYRPGDPISRIHWKLTGKRGIPVVREASRPVDHSLILFADRSGGPASPALADAYTETAASLCKSLTDAGMEFHFVYFEETAKRREVTTEEDLTEVISDLLKAGPQETGLGGFKAYTEAFGPLRHGRVLYLAYEKPEETDLPSGLPIRYLICGEKDAAQGNTLFFSPAHMQEELQDALIE